MKTLESLRSHLRTAGWLFYAAGLFLAASASSALAVEEGQNSMDRTSQRLDGDWRVVVDPYESGFYDYRGKENPNGIFKDRDWSKTKDLVEYDFDHSMILKVPGDWNSQREDLKYYEGTVGYRRLFKAEPRKDRRAFLRFESVNYEAVVYLNGEKLGSHLGGFTPFEFEVTGKLKSGRNSLVVKVDNRRKAEGVPTLQTDWWNYGGITRSVSLVERPQTYIADWSVQLDAAGRVQAWARLEGGKGGESLRVEIPELSASGAMTFASGKPATVLLDAQPERWSPEHPKRYRVKLSAGEDTLEDQVGFRTVETRGPDILLNGQPVFLRGICLHDEPFGPKAGRIRNPLESRKLLKRAKELGCNFVRLAHYPHAEFMVREAESLGLLVWAEIPVYWTIHWKDPQTLQNAQAQLEAVIRRDRNRAAVIIWSVGNETPLSSERMKFMSALVDEARELDNTRLISAALEQHGDKQRYVDDPLGAKLDVLGLNEYIGWYDGPPEKCRTLRWKTAWNKPLVISEFGADAKQGRHGKDGERWTEEYQAFVYREQLAMLGKIPNLRGITPWILKDFRSPRRWLPGIQDGWNRKGLLSETGKKKKAFGILRDYYRSLAGKGKASGD